MKLAEFKRVPEGHTMMHMFASSVDTPVELASDKRSYIPEVQQYLPAAAEVLNISANIKDYVVVPLIIFPSDLPNRNCLAGDTIVATNAGMIPIKDLAYRDDATHVITKDGKARIKNWMMNGYKPLHDVYTKGGKHIRATGTHPFLVMNPNNCVLKWTNVNDLQPGDKIIVTTGSIVDTPVDLTMAGKAAKAFGEKLIKKNGNQGRFIFTNFPKTMSSELARFIGYIQSEGTIRRGRISFINTDMDLMNDFVHCCELLFGFRPPIDARPKGAIRTGKWSNIRSKKTCYTATMYGMDIVYWLDQLGVKSVTQPKREVPRCIFDSTPEHIKEYLKAYIEGDGSIGSSGVSIFSSSKKMIQGLKLLLESLDIISIATERSPKNGGIIYQVRLAEAWDAINTIGTISQQSQKELVAWGAKRETSVGQSHSRHRLLPREVAYWVSKNIQRHKIKSTRGGNYYMDYRGDEKLLNFKNNITMGRRVNPDKLLQVKATLKELNPKYGAIIDDLIGDFVFDEIAEVRYNTILEKVYDIETSAAQLTANGVVVHNSVAFPYEELMKFNPHRGTLTYKTWRGMPTFVEHAHHDYEQAKGIIFDTYIKKIPDVIGDLYKVVALCGFDRDKDPALASRILKKQATRYSMGASVGTYECSICGSLSPNNRRDTECGHVTRGSIALHNTKQGRKPAYYLARNISGFEISSVGTPAWTAAEETHNIFDMAL